MGRRPSCLAVVAVVFAGASCDIFAALTGAEGLPCTRDEACPVGSTCVAGACRNGECRSDGECLAGQRCAHGFCTSVADAAVADRSLGDLRTRDRVTLDGGDRDGAARDTASGDVAPVDGAVHSDVPTVDASTGDAAVADLRAADRSGDAGGGDAATRDTATADGAWLEASRSDLVVRDGRVLDAHLIVLDGLWVEDARRDGGPLPTCDELFGAAPGYLYCRETPRSCEFSTDLAGATCAALCVRFGSICVAAFDNVLPSLCDYNTLDDDCQTARSNEICVCTR